MSGFKKFVCGCTAAVLATSLTFASTARAAEEAPAEPAGPNTGKVHVAGGMDFASSYFFRGIAQENEGVIGQPWLEVTFDITDWMSMTGGIWNSIHDGASTSTGGSMWYEADAYVGASFSLPYNLTFDATYIVLYSPTFSSAFAEEVDLSLAYDDSELWGDLLPSGLQPYMTFAIETTAGSDALGRSGDKGVYFEFGIEPSVDLIDSETMPVSFSLPVTVGFDLDGDYYETATGDDDSGFGYVDVGFIFSAPLTFMPSDYGAWSISGGVHLNYASDDVASIGSSFGIIDSDQQFNVYGVFGFSFEY